MFVGLDQKKSHMVNAGSMHCVCLTGEGVQEDLWRGIHFQDIYFVVNQYQLSYPAVNT